MAGLKDEGFLKGTKAENTIKPPAWMHPEAYVVFVRRNSKDESKQTGPHLSSEVSAFSVL